MKPKLGDILVYNYRDAFTSVAPIRVVMSNHEANFYTLQNQITGQESSWTGEQLDIYYHYENRPNPRNLR
jgi:hypothetical protein